jgi:hypothetical protein
MEKHHHRSFFWPVVLIGGGVIWLLHNLGIIASVNLGFLLKLWPLLLVLVGLEILFGRRAAWVGGLIGLFLVGGVVALLVFGPPLGISSPSQFKTETFSAPLENTTSVLYDLKTSSTSVNIKPLTSSDKLIDAVITHRGEINFAVSTGVEKRVSLSETFTPEGIFVWDFSNNSTGWEIGLSPYLPTAIELNGGSGAINADLSGIMLTSLKTSLGSGSSTFKLPESAESYAIDLESGSGSVNLSLPAQTDIELSLDSGSGSIHISLPDGYTLRLEVYDDGSGSLNTPSGLLPVTGTQASYGAWQTEGYDQAAHKIVVKILSRGSGSININ